MSDEAQAKDRPRDDAAPRGVAPPAGDLTGEKVAGRYRVVGRLGAGGFGDVYKALDEKLMSRAVVIKVLKDGELKRERMRDWLLVKFQQEIEALSRIRDPGVVGIVDADRLPDGRPYLVMESVEGVDLRQFLREARESPEQGLRLQDVAEIVRQAGRTLTAAHDEEVVHRDLKPENIMLRRSASGGLQVKVIDFGVAKVRNSVVARSTATAHVTAGTWLYMAPEQLRQKKVGPACDTYALGVLAYEMVTGRLPFAAREAGLLKELQAAGVKVKPRDLNPDLPEAAQQAILKALSYYPADRHERACDFGDELARALADEEELVRPPASDPEAPTLRNAVGPTRPARAEEAAAAVSPPPVTPGPRPRRVLGFAVAAVLLAGLLGFTAWLVFRTKAPAPPPQVLAAPDAGPARTLTYWLSMQRPRDSKPFDSVGERVFDPGSQFWFNVQTTQAGALYLFGEGFDGGRPSELNTMYPTPKSGRGDARLPPDKLGPVTDGPYKFRGAGGVIHLWVIWAERPVAVLDQIVRASYDTGGTIREAEHQTALRAFIEQHREPRPEVVTDEVGPRVTLKGRGEVLVDVRKLEYRP